MKLSVVIVNYNVRYFLEQCLISLKAALNGIEAEIFVVDNDSSDKSVEMLRNSFQDIHLIANSENVGFSKANNQAIRQSKGEFILLLNPDTVVGEDSISKVLAFMERTSDCGALGVRMIDGSGKFLPESKRGLPRPLTSFFKMSGLSTLFPKSKIFNKYHLGYLDEHQIHRVDVLSGACMFLRKKVLNEIGLLDESFFMYGEDIDLSYRVQLGGYENYYFPKTQIIHYKGESTKKGSLNYVKVFYNAMIIFAKKHFSYGKVSFYILAIQAAIFIKAALSFIKGFLSKTLLFFLDAASIYFGLHIVKNLWANYQFNDPNYYANSNMYILIPVYTLIWVVSIFFGTGYDKETKFWKLFKSIGFGSILLFAIYGLLPDTSRSSRAIILFGFAATIIISFGWRIILNLIKSGRLLQNAKEKNLLIIGSEEESRRAVELLNLAKVNFNYSGTLSMNKIDSKYIAGSIDNLEEFIHVKSINELIFCSKDINNKEISRWMSKLGADIRYKILPENSLGIIGSSSKNTSGELYTIDIRYNIHEAMHLRNKRLIDVVFSLIAIILSPIFLLIGKEKTNYFNNCVAVLLGRKSWVGYANWDDQVADLPVLKKGVLSPQSYSDKYDEKVHHQINLIYARDYNIWRDLAIIWKNIKYLGWKKK